MPSVGEKLRQARVKQGLSIAQVAARTKIGSRFLEAIEDDERQKLPAGFFYKNWVSQYAEALKLDVEAIGKEVDNMVAGDAPPPLPGQPSASIRDVRPAPMSVSVGQGNRGAYSIGMLILVVLGCSGFYAWWRNMQVQANENQENKPSHAVAAKLENPAALQPVEPAGTNPVVEASPKPDLAPPPATAPAVTSLGDLHVEISASEAAWLSITPDGKQIFADTLLPSQVKTVDAQSAVRIRVGNAGGVNVTVNGKPIGPIGPNGQVRTVVIDRSGFQIVKPAPPTSPASGDNAPLAPALN